MAEPPLEVGALNEMLACTPPVAVTADVIVGAPGTVRGVTDADTAAGLLPAMFVAITVQLYGVPLVSPVTVIGDPAPAALNAPHVAV